MPAAAAALATVPGRPGRSERSAPLLRPAARPEPEAGQQARRHAGEEEARADLASLHGHERDKRPVRPRRYEQRESLFAKAGQPEGERGLPGRKRPLDANVEARLRDVGQLDEQLIGAAGARRQAHRQTRLPPAREDLGVVMFRYEGDGAWSEGDDRRGAGAAVREAEPAAEALARRPSPLDVEDVDCKPVAVEPARDVGGHPVGARGRREPHGLDAPGCTGDHRCSDVADQFDLLADLLELDGAESFRVIAYRRAASRMRETSGSVAQLALDGKAKQLQGIGKTIEEKIVELVETGAIAALEKKRAGVPPEVVLFMRLPGLGPKTAARIWRELGVETLAELKTAALDERLRTLTGLGPKSEEKILAALAFQAQTAQAGDRRLLGEGLPAVQAAVAALAELPSAISVSEAGSVRRRKETFRDLDVIASATEPAELTERFTQLPFVVDVAAHGDTKATVVSRDGLRFDLRVVPPESFGNLLQHFTGSKDHNVAMREDAVRRGLS